MAQEPCNFIVVQRIDGHFIYSASDLNNFIECRHLTQLESAVARGEQARPPEKDPMTLLIAQKGMEHEQRYLDGLIELGVAVEIFHAPSDQSMAALEDAERRTVAAMEHGAEHIYQATFFDGTFVGHADFLRRVDKPCARWSWSYEVIDTKLALTPKPYFLIQLCNYSEHLERLQGTPPEFGSIILGSGEERRFYLNDYLAYCRHVKAAFLESMQNGRDSYPLECAHCAICPWNMQCERQRDRDDHLSIVAGIRRDQIAKLETAGIATLAQLAQARDDQKPPKMPESTFAHLRAQAMQQHRHREAKRNGDGTQHFYSFRPRHNEASGFAKLPAPAPGDMFFDIEGDPLYRPDRGLEYLWGIYLPDEDQYKVFWATDPSQERSAFEQVVDFICERRKRYPNAHVYHYAPYEISTLKRLMGRFASREREVDDFLRQGVFVDLFHVVRQALWISQPSYSIKKLEAFYGFERETQVKGGDDSIVMFESWLVAREDAILEDIRAYNEDDCRSTYHLREWLRGVRDELNAILPEPIPWRPDPEVAAAEDSSRTELETALLDAVPAPDSLAQFRGWDESLRGRWLLGNLLQFHRREVKPEWWQYFDRCANPDDLQDMDDEALGGLSLRSDFAPYKDSESDRNLVYTYEFPAQEYRLPHNPHNPDTGKSAGEIIDIDRHSRLLKIKLAKAIDPASLRALIPTNPLPQNKKRAAMERIAQAFMDNALAKQWPATRDLLLSRKPQLRSGGSIQPSSVTKESVSNAIQSLDKSYLFIQGPPGSGKTTFGASAIVDLLQNGKRVGIAAHTHKAVHNLLRKVEQVAAERHFVFSGCHKESASTEGSAYEAYAAWPMVASSDDIKALTAETCRLAAGTTYAWADQSLVDQFDYIFIDEAGQVALADALICSIAAKNTVLLGDPLQLPQVTKGSHPIGADRSILEHLLGDYETVPKDRGLFLDVSYRLQPQICEFLSDAIYEGRLRNDPSTDLNLIDSPGLSGSGLVYTPVIHDGNGRRSDEEAERIRDEIEKLLGGTVTIKGDAPRPLTQSDILVVTPYNLQRVRIMELLEAAGYGDVRVGTVDKFQGQEAPAVLYSMATSSSQTLPRDAAFLFDKNRFNVAISRAQCLAVILCNPQLLDTKCRNPEQMAMVNLLCAYVERATKSATSLSPPSAEQLANGTHRQNEPQWIRRERLELS